MLAVDFIHARYHEKNGYEPWVFQLNRSGVRLLQHADLSNLPFQFREISYNEFDLSQPCPAFVDMLHFVEHSCPDTCVFFLEQAAHAVWLNFFMRGKTRLVLAPDGNKPYLRVTRKALYSRTTETIRIYRFLAACGYRLFQPYYQSLNYGRLRGVDEIWVEYPEFYQGAHAEKLVEYRFLASYAPDHPLNHIYHFSKAELPFTENGIYYVNNILYEQYLYDIEIDVLKTIRSLHPGAPLVIKYHPGTPPEQLEKFKTIEGVKLFSSTIPFELIVASLRNCMIVGMWSNALMHNNPACNFYWLNRYLQKRGQMLQRLKVLNPSRHIREIEELDQLCFPEPITLNPSC